MQGVAFSEVNGNNLAAPRVQYMATLRFFCGDIRERSS